MVQQHVATYDRPVGRVAVAGEDTGKSHLARCAGGQLLRAVAVHRVGVQPQRELGSRSRNLFEHDLVSRQAEGVGRAVVREVDVQNAAVLGVGETSHGETVAAVGDPDRGHHVRLAGLETERAAHVSLADAGLGDVLGVRPRHAVDESDADEHCDDDVSGCRLLVGIAVHRAAEQGERSVQHDGGQQAAGDPVHDSLSLSLAEK